jgi:hypothetical protein
MKVQSFSVSLGRNDLQSENLTLVKLTRYRNARNKTDLQVQIRFGRNCQSNNKNERLDFLVIANCSRHGILGQQKGHKRSLLLNAMIKHYFPCSPPGIARRFGRPQCSFGRSRNRQSGRFRNGQENEELPLPENGRSNLIDNL